jgi:hypothetical protein
LTEKVQLRERLFFLDRCVPKAGASPEESAECCIRFVDTFCYTFDPKREPYHFRFRLFPFQRDLVRQLVRCVMLGEDVMVDKCREMGATYTALDVLLWFWLCVPGSNFLLGSRKEDAVDNTKAGSDTTNKEESLFGKLEYTINRLSPAARPEGFDTKRHIGYMSLVNPALGNVVSGESANDNFSRGGRQKAILLDEFAFWDSDASAWGSTADTTNCRIVLTTPGIRPSKAKRLRFGTDGEEIRVITLRHDLDPRKDAAWIDRERKRRSKEDFAREIMIDWEGSLTGIVYPEIAYASKGDYPYDPRWPLYCGWDFGLDGISIGWYQTNPNSKRLRMVDYYQNADRPIQFYYPFLGRPVDERYASLYTVDDIRAMRELRILRNPTHYGDPDVGKRSLLTGTSTRHELSKEGIDVLCNTMANDFASRREQAKITLQGGLEVNDTPRTRQWLLCMENARYPQRSDSSQATSAVTLPIHDWTSHGRTQFEFLCVNLNLGTGSAPTGKVLRPSSEPSVRTRPTFDIGRGGETVPDDILGRVLSALPKSRP